MLQTRNGLYTTIFILTFIGWFWLLMHAHNKVASELNVCFVKATTGFPCPACGTTRSIQTILEGKPLDGFVLNPFGFIVLAIMAIAPLWILRDWFVHSNSFFAWYRKMELRFTRPVVARSFFLLVIINWFWNFYKGY